MARTTPSLHKVSILTTKRGTAQFGPNLFADGLVCLSLLGTWEGPGREPSQSSLLQVLVSIQGLVLGMRHPHFNEPGYGGWEGTETETGEGGASCRAARMAGPTCRPTRGGRMKFFCADLDVACAFALETRRESPFSDAILAHLATRSPAIATTVETRIAEARSDYPATAQRFEVVLRRTLTTFQERLAAAVAEPAVLPPTPAAPAAPPTTPAAYDARCAHPPAAAAPQPPPAPPADAEEIARLEARLEELRRRNNAGPWRSPTTTRHGRRPGMRAPRPRPGRRLDLTETAPDPAPALAARSEAEARRAAPRESSAASDVADKRAAFLAHVAP